MQPTKILEQMNKIKKSFAVVAVLLLMSSNVNALIRVSHACFDWADREATRQGFIQGWTYEEEHTAFLALYDYCNNQPQQ